MSGHPINDVSGLTTTDDVSKSGLVNYEKLFVPLRLADADALRAIDLTGSWLVFIAGLAYTRDASDPTASDDGAWTIRDGGDNVWKKTPQLNSFDAYGLTAAKSAHDAEAAGYTYFSLDEYGFYVRIGVSGTWSSLVPFRGPRGGDVYDLAVQDSGRPSTGETLLSFLFTRAVTFPAGLTLSRAKSVVAATASSVFSIQKNGVQFGTMTFAISATTATFAAASQTDFAAGDTITVVAPNPRDNTLSGVYGTLAGTRN